jgi:hypothetical protein
VRAAQAFSAGTEVRTADNRGPKACFSEGHSARVVTRLVVSASRGRQCRVCVAAQVGLTRMRYLCTLRVCAWKFGCWKIVRLLGDRAVRGTARYAVVDGWLFVWMARDHGESGSPPGWGRRLRSPGSRASFVGSARGARRGFPAAMAGLGRPSGGRSPASMSMRAVASALPPEAEVR